MVSWLVSQVGWLVSPTELNAHILHALQVIGKLIAQGNTLAVLSKPEREAGEDDAAYASRQQLERVLSLHANYAPNA